MSEAVAVSEDRGDEVITAPVAAREKGVAPVSVYKAIRDGRLKATRSGKIYLIRRRDLDAWQVVGHRPQRPRVQLPEPSGFVLPTPEEWKEPAQKAIHLLNEWMADESGYDEETWPIIKKAIEENRLSYRKRFDD